MVREEGEGTANGKLDQEEPRQGVIALTRELEEEPPVDHKAMTENQGQVRQILFFFCLSFLVVYRRKTATHFGR